MDRTELLLGRLEAIGASLATEPDALALIGLGSVGIERGRLDRYSDLDFFAIVREGSKARYLESLDWLSRAAPVAWSFANTADGRKLLYEDGVFCEYAVFTPDELARAAFSPGRVVWKAAGVPGSIALPSALPVRPEPRPTEWLVGEALTNLYVGLCRERRGERLSAARFIQGYALDRVLELAERERPGAAEGADAFTIDRRYERRVPAMSAELPALMQGYARNGESARAILAWLEARHPVDRLMKSLILELSEAK